MSRQLRNIETAFRHVRLFTLVVVAAAMVTCCYTVYESYHMVSEAQERIYLLAGDEAWQAFAGNRKDNIPVEAKAHIQSFHHYFFTLDPDDKVIESNIGRALYLADASAKRQYDNLEEGGYYSGIISGNISQEVRTDSVRVSTGSYPYYFRYYGTQRIIRPTAILERSLVTEGYLRSVSRSDNNPHGFLIERWNILENRDLHTKNR